MFMDTAFCFISSLILTYWSRRPSKVPFINHDRMAGGGQAADADANTRLSINKRLSLSLDRRGNNLCCNFSFPSRKFAQRTTAKHARQAAASEKDCPRRGCVMAKTKFHAT